MSEYINPCDEQQLAELQAKIDEALATIAELEAVINNPTTPEAVRQRLVPKVARAKILVARWQARLEVLLAMCDHYPLPTPQ